MPQSIKNWVRISLINLLVVSILGCLMRYKIAFPFPLVDQKFLLHAHSHFAFSGWVSQLLMSLMVFHLYRFSLQNACNNYRIYLCANLICAYGMLISFVLQGYGIISICFSTLSIFVNYAFAVKFGKDVKKIKQAGIANYWFLAALMFNVLSSIGPFHLAYMMATNTINESNYLKSIYFFLHFQYNGWFLFGCMGLLFSWMKTKRKEIPHQGLIIGLNFIACFPAYLLSVLWLPVAHTFLPVVIVAVIMQFAGFFLLMRGLIKRGIFSRYKGKTGLQLWKLAVVAYSIKLCLQAGSTIPALSKLAFGFRPIVIGYLHLVLLGVITIFLLGYLFLEKMVVYNRLAKTGLIIFLSGIILNEILLMIQGVAAIEYVMIPYINEMLFAAAITLFSGLLLLSLSQRKKQKEFVIPQSVEYLEEAFA